MRHRKIGRRLGRRTDHREAMIRNMVTSLFEHERIVTTVPKAKEARKFADKMMTLAKRGDLHARRQALAFIRSETVVSKLFGALKDGMHDRAGGYTRIIHTGTRKGDSASMSILELVTYQPETVAAA